MDRRGARSPAALHKVGRGGPAHEYAHPETERAGRTETGRAGTVGWWFGADTLLSAVRLEPVTARSAWAREAGSISARLTAKYGPYRRPTGADAH